MLNPVNSHDATRSMKRHHDALLGEPLNLQLELVLPPFFGGSSSSGERWCASPQSQQAVSSFCMPVDRCTKKIPRSSSRFGDEQV